MLTLWMECRERDFGECVVHFYSTCFTLVLKEVIRRDDVTHENVANMSKRLFQLIPSTLHQWKRLLQAECSNEPLLGPCNWD